MKTKVKLILSSLLVIVMVACGGEPKANNSENSTTEDTFEKSMRVQKRKEAIAEKITKRLCDDFPKNIILKNNPDGKRIVVEPVEFVPGKIDHCSVKLFHGDRDYDYWEGSVSVRASRVANPLAQYDSNRNKELFQKVEGFGEKAMYIANVYQLLIVKDGLVYDLVPPSRGRTTSSGVENKDIVFEMAKHYKL